MVEKILPGETIGIIGGNEIGRFLAMAAKNMGFKVGLLDPSPICPAAKVVDWQLEAEFEYSYALKELGEHCKVVFTTVPYLAPKSLRYVSQFALVPQNVQILEILQDCLLEKALLEETNMLVPPYASIINITDIQDAIDGIGYPCLLKTNQKNHGKESQLLFTSPSDISKALTLLKQGPCILEASIPDARELAMTVVGDGKGNYQLFPPVEITRKEQRLQKASLPVPLPTPVLQELERMAKVLGEKLSLQGALTIEVLMTEFGGLYVKALSLVPLPYTFIYGDTCQMDIFSACLKGIANWKLTEKTAVFSPGVWLEILKKDRFKAEDAIDELSNGKFYFYGKVGRQSTTPIGHITVLGEELKEIKETVEKLKIWE